MISVTDFPTICFLFCLMQPVPGVAVNNFGQECRIIRPSRKDTAETLRQVATENARCRAAKGEKK